VSDEVISHALEIANQKKRAERSGGIGPRGKSARAS
jgi:hypothetical protein